MLTVHLSILVIQHVTAPSVERALLIMYHHYETQALLPQGFTFLYDPSQSSLPLSEWKERRRIALRGFWRASPQNGTDYIRIQPYGHI